MSIEDLLERISSFAAKRARLHFGREDDGTMSFSEDYKAYISILDDATTALTKLREPKSRIGEYACEECVHPEFNSCNECINKPRTEQPSAGEFTKKCRLILRSCDGNVIWKKLKEACRRLDRAEAINKDLLAALEKYGRHGVVGGDICEKSKHSDYNCTCGFEATTGKAKKEGGE